MLTPTRMLVNAAFAKRPPITINFGSFDVGDLLVGCVHLGEILQQKASLPSRDPTHRLDAPNAAMTFTSGTT